MRHIPLSPHPPDSGRLLQACTREDGVWTLWERDPGPPEQLGAFPRVKARETLAFLCGPGLSNLAEFQGQVLWADNTLDTVLTYAGSSLTLYRRRKEGGGLGDRDVAREAGADEVASQSSVSVLNTLKYSRHNYPLPEFAIPAAATVAGGLVACVYAEKKLSEEKHEMVAVDSSTGLPSEVVAMMFAWAQVFSIAPDSDRMGWPEGGFPVAVPIRDWVDAVDMDGPLLKVHFRSSRGERLLYKLPAGRYTLRIRDGGAVMLLNGGGDLRPRRDKTAIRQYYAGAPEIIRVSGSGAVAYVIPCRERSVVVQVRDGAVAFAADLFGRAIACDDEALYVCRVSPREILCVRRSDLLADRGTGQEAEGASDLLRALSGLPYVPGEAKGVEYITDSEGVRDIALFVQTLQLALPKVEADDPSLEYAAQLDEIASMLGDSQRELDALVQQLESAQRLATDIT